MPSNKTTAARKPSAQKPAPARKKVSADRKPAASSRAGRGMAKVKLREKAATSLESFLDQVMAGEMGELRPRRAAGLNVLRSLKNGASEAKVTEKIRGAAYVEVDTSAAARSYFVQCWNAFKDAEKAPFKLLKAERDRLDEVANTFQS